MSQDPDAPETPADAVGPTLACGPASLATARREPVTGRSRDGSSDRRSLDGGAGDAAALDQQQRYVMRDLLGEGGMGRVRLVDDRHIGREVAVKSLHPDVAASEHGTQRFLREARVQGQLEHPSIVPVYDLGHDADGQPFFTMRRLQGTTLEEVLARSGDPDDGPRGPWSRRKLLTAFVSVCMAVHYAHTRGVIHRDLKPTNIMLGEFGEVYVLDWGVARVLDQPEPEPDEAPPPEGGDAGPDATATGALLGTPAYMSPEQLRGQHHSLDGRSDVYALGMILYELCTGRAFHAGKGFMKIASETLLGVRVVPSEAAPDVPPELDALVLRCTALDPGDRFATVGELARAVEAYLDGDRDLQRRRALAGEHAQRALDAADRSAGAAGLDYEALRKEAMSAVVQSLALDPEQRDARRTFVRLLVEAPAEPPPSVREDMREYAMQTRREGLRFGIVGLLAWCAAIPAALALGVRDLPAALLACLAVVLFTLAMVWMFRARVQRVRHSFAVGLAATLAIMSMSTWLGPFVLVPAAATAVLTMMAVCCEPAERRVLLALGAVTTLLPFGLEAAGLVPRSLVMEDGRLVLVERVFALHPRRTLLALLYTNVAFTLVPQLLVGRIRDQLLALQQRFVTQAWHLRQIVGERDEPGGERDGPVTRRDGRSA